MVEPVPYVFDRLRRNYGGLDRVALENLAIADHDGSLPFYYLAQVDDPEREGLPQWYDGIGSFSRDAVLGHSEQIPDIERRVVETEVPCVTFESLCRRHGVARVDLLLIDTEGYDWEVLKLIDFRAHRPRLVIYEHFHLVERERRQCRAHLEGLGYETMGEHFDTFCLDTAANDRLTRVWRRLRPALPAVFAREPSA
jgi:FkbM family methyltransferase